MIVMPANSTGWFFQILARETGKLGHLFSPGAQRGPYPWFPYAFDNGAFSCWEPKTNTFDNQAWGETEPKWLDLLRWGFANEQPPLWALVPDIPGNAEGTIERWSRYAPIAASYGFPLAVAVQDGMTPSDIRKLQPAPTVVFVGGSTEWKWGSVPMWCREFPRVHVGRVNSPTKLRYLEGLRVESCDGTGWNRGDMKQTSGLEEWCRERTSPYTGRIAPILRPRLKPDDLL